MYSTISLEKSQYATLDNYKLTRGLWWALFDPAAGRHDALLAEDIPDVYRRLFDHIRADTFPEDDDPEALALLDVVTNLKTPHKLRRTLPRLADEFFRKSADDDDDGLDISGGDWPGAPAHNCAAKEATGTALIIRPNETTAARMFNPTWRTCPACYHKRVKRIAKQTLIEIVTAGAMSWTVFDAADYRKWAGNIRQHRKRQHDRIDEKTNEAIAELGSLSTAEDIERIKAAGLIEKRKTDPHYRALPQAAGRVFVMSTHGIVGGQVPTDNRALYDLLHAHANTPDDKRASSSRGYGGDYKRLRGDGRAVKGVRLWTDARLEAVAAALGGALGGAVKPARNTFRVEIDQYDAFQKMSDAGIVMRARKGEGAAVQSLIDVTLKVQSSELDSLYLKRDTEGDELPIAPQVQPPLNDSPPEEVQTWPIYLP